jgi:hypothetical protein
MDNDPQISLMTPRREFNSAKPASSADQVVFFLGRAVTHDLRPLPIGVTSVFILYH